MTQPRLYRYVIRAASQKESEAVHIWHQSKKQALAEFVQNHPEFKDEPIVGRKFNAGDRYSEQMNDDTQGL